LAAHLNDCDAYRDTCVGKPLVPAIAAMTISTCLQTALSSAASSRPMPPTIGSVLQKTPPYSNHAGGVSCGGVYPSRDG